METKQKPVALITAALKAFVFSVALTFFGLAGCKSCTCYICNFFGDFFFKLAHNISLSYLYKRQNGVTISATPLIFPLRGKRNIKMPPTFRPTANIEYVAIESYHTSFRSYSIPLGHFVKGD